MCVHLRAAVLCCSSSSSSSSSFNLFPLPGSTRILLACYFYSAKSIVLRPSSFFFVIVVVVVFASFSRCVGRASFTRPCRFQNYWHGVETGWQRLSGYGYRGAKCALAFEAEGWVVVPGGAAGGGWSHEEKGGGDGGGTRKAKVGTEASGRSLEAGERLL